MNKALKTGLMFSPLLLIAAVGGRKSYSTTAGGDVGDELRMYAARLEQRGVLPGLGTFLTAVAKFESGFNPKAVGPTQDYGLFQILEPTVDLPSSTLLTIPGSVAAAAINVRNLLVNRGAPGQKVDWYAIRRGWAIPSLVSDTRLTKEKSRVNKKRFDKAMQDTGIPKSFGRQRVVLGDWPGRNEVLDIMGVG